MVVHGERDAVQHTQHTTSKGDADSKRTPRESDRDVFGGVPQGGAVSGGAPAEPRQEGERQIPPPGENFDSRRFTCAGCATEVVVIRERGQSVEDFALMCEWRFGHPPVCAECLSWNAAG